MTINKEINDFFDLKPINKLYAPYDAYPDLDWTLESQFAKNKNKLESLKKDLILKQENISKLEFYIMILI